MTESDHGLVSQLASQNKAGVLVLHPHGAAGGAVAHQLLLHQDHGTAGQQHARQPAVADQDIANANIYAVYQNRALYRYIGEVDPDLKAQALVNVDKFERGMWDFLASYRKTYLTQREVDLLTRFDQAWATYKQYASGS